MQRPITWTLHALSGAPLVAAGLLALAAPTPAFAQEVSDAVRAAVANGSRPVGDRARDEGRKPARALAFFGVTPRTRLFEYGAGGGYFTELFAHIAGPGGQVIAQNPFGFLRFAEDEIKQRLASNRLGNVVFAFGNAELMHLADNSIDAVFIIDTYHDVAYAASSGESPSAAATAALLEARRVLKPGGVFGVIDHRARIGATRAEAAGLHRIAEATLRRDFEAAGLIFDGSLEIYANPADDRSKAWFADPVLRDRTDRLIHRYRSPD